MAFRKKVKCNYRPFINCGGFSETKSVPVERGDGSSREEVVRVSISDIAKTSLPMLDLQSIVSSGKPIIGNVDFSPSVHNVEQNVMDFMSTHLPGNSDNV